MTCLFLGTREPAGIFDAVAEKRSCNERESTGNAPVNVEDGAPSMLRVAGSQGIRKQTTKGSSKRDWSVSADHESQEQGANVPALCVSGFYCKSRQSPRHYQTVSFTHHENSKASLETPIRIQSREEAIDSSKEASSAPSQSSVGRGS